MTDMLNTAVGIVLGFSALAILAIVGAGFSPYPDTAPGTQSALTIHVDYATGVHYVSTISGGLSVRVDADGKPITTSEGGE